MWGVLKARIFARAIVGARTIGRQSFFTEHAKTAQNFESDRRQRANVRSLVPVGITFVLFETSLT
jgi:hypothetical protein